MKFKTEDGFVTFPAIKGEDGYTPVKGVDYFTNTDKAELVSELRNEGYVRNLNVIPMTGFGYPVDQTAFRITTTGGTYNFAYHKVYKGKTYTVKRTDIPETLIICMTANRPVVTVNQNVPIVSGTYRKMYGGGNTEVSYDFTAPQDGYLLIYTKVKADLAKVDVLLPSAYPCLDRAQKTAIFNLLDDWNNKRTNCMEYKSGSELDDFVDGSCFSTVNGKLQLSCNTFVSNIMMGRRVTDYIVDGSPISADDYSNVIHQADGFENLGFYPRFPGREFYQMAKWDGTLKKGGTELQGFYNLKVDEDGFYYSVNSYYNSAGLTDYHQVFKSFLNANDLCKELEDMGCEIPLSEIDIGDVVFFEANDDDQVGETPVSDNTKQFHKHAYKHIGHVAIVKQIRNGFPLFAHAAGSNSNGINVFTEDDYNMGNDLRMYALLHNYRIVSVCRFPAAFGYGNNVPETITVPN